MRDYLENGQDPNIRNERNETPLHTIINYIINFEYYPESLYDTLVIFLEKGANIHDHDNRMATPFYLALENKKKQKCNRVLNLFNQYNRFFYHMTERKSATHEEMKCLCLMKSLPVLLPMELCRIIRGYVRI
jgi:ankyrin repeat protein